MECTKWKIEKKMKKGPSTSPLFFLKGHEIAQAIILKEKRSDKFVREK